MSYDKAYYETHKSAWKANYAEHREERKLSMRRYYQDHKEEMKANANQRYHALEERFNPAIQRAAFLKRQYGITQEHFDSMLFLQHGRCKICGRTAEETGIQQKILCVDHDHTTGRVRGLLCRHCNIKVGWYERYQSIINPYLAQE